MKDNTIVFLQLRGQYKCYYHDLKRVRDVSMHKMAAAGVPSGTILAVHLQKCSHLSKREKIRRFLALSLVILLFPANLFSWGVLSIITFLTKACCFRICNFSRTFSKTNYISYPVHVSTRSKVSSILKPQRQPRQRRSIQISGVS
jgi:hypothetical protein